VLPAGMGRRRRQEARGAPTRDVLRTREVLRPRLERLHPLQRSGLRPHRLRRRPLQHCPGRHMNNINKNYHMNSFDVYQVTNQ